MNTRVLKILSLVLISLFLLMRFGMNAHASAYKHSPHEHNGKICVLTLISEDDVDDVAILPDTITVQISAPQHICLDDITTPIFKHSIVTPSARGSP